MNLCVPSSDTDAGATAFTPSNRTAALGVRTLLPHQAGSGEDDDGLLAWMAGTVLTGIAFVGGYAAYLRWYVKKR